MSLYELVKNLQKKRICARVEPLKVDEHPQLLGQTTSKSKNFDVEQSGKLTKNIANYGIKQNQHAMVCRKGIYYGLTVQVLEDLKPLLTNVRMSKVVQLLEQENIKLAQIELGVNDIKTVYYVSQKWLEKMEFPIPHYISDHYEKINDPLLDQWIFSTRSDTVPCKLKITNIGQSKGNNSVVPESWIGKEFKSGQELHDEMNKLEWRKNQSPVKYCCTYGMIIKDEKIWKNYEELNDISSQTYILLTNEFKVSFVSQEQNHSLTDIFEEYCKYDFLIGENDKYVIGCHKNFFFKDKPIYEDTPNVGVLVSRLQKSIRRGPFCCQTLQETIRLLNKSKPYNLPEQQFIRVSGTKQLLWRLFITIIEDVSFYQSKKYLNLSVLLALVLICHQDSSLQLNDVIEEKIKGLALIMQSFPDAWNWRFGKKDSLDMKFSEDNTDALKTALKHIPMMRGDREMLAKSINYLQIFNIPSIDHIKVDLNFSRPEKELLCQYVANDMHCYPNILLLLQGSLSSINKIYDTFQLSRFIWDHSSGLNYRYLRKNINMNFKLKDTLLEIQKFIFENHGMSDLNNFAGEDKDVKKIVKKKYLLEQVESHEISPLMARVGFLLIFGKKMRVGKYEVIVAGTDKYPCKVKKPSVKRNYHYLDGKDRFIGELEYVKLHETPQKIKLPEPPEGFQWTIPREVYSYMALEKSDKTNFCNKIAFHIHDHELQPFNARSIMVPIGVSIESQEDDFIQQLVKQALYIISCRSQFTLNLIMRRISYLRKKYQDDVLYKWSHLLKESKVPHEIWRILLTRLISLDEVMIGPVSRSGDKIEKVISYQYEGLLWRFMNMLSMLYPMSIEIGNNFKFKLNKNHCSFQHLINVLRTLLSVEKPKGIMKIMNPIIKTTLWEHQSNATNKIYDSIVNTGRRGHCDASCVGSGKTLTALSIASKLMNYDQTLTNSGILILLPSNQLYSTWIDEVKKHTKYFEINNQYADGHLDNNDINHHTLVLTTLGRMRDHPIIHPWLFVIIDECTKVCNTTLQTEEAWRQSIQSKYGVLMMSASFFTTRFEKLFYMLKMLDSKLPCKVEYLDTILSEHLICCVGEESRTWLTHIYRFPLKSNLRLRYDQILKQKESYEKKYMALSQLLFKQCDYIALFKNVIEHLDENQRALIYARSKEEADMISQEIDNVFRYQTRFSSGSKKCTNDNSKKHIVLSYAEGTYGLNDLVIYNTIITRPPEPNALPQMKGRLDRPNQKSHLLKIYYLLNENTIEEAQLTKLEMARGFYKQHIMPLAEFYKLAIELSSQKEDVMIMKNKEINEMYQILMKKMN